MQPLIYFVYHLVTFDGEKKIPNLAWTLLTTVFANP